VGSPTIIFFRAATASGREPPWERAALSVGQRGFGLTVDVLTGAAFDCADVDHEVVCHQQVLDAIDKVLLPNAKKPEPKALIEKVRPVIASLQHAKLVQTQLSGGASGPAAR